MRPSPFKLPPYIPALDAIRGIAIVAVILHNQTVLGEGHGVFEKAYLWLTSFGYVGVHLFFVLSGFLITGILQDTRESPNYYRAFYGRRTLRIFPLYYMALIVTFVVLPLCGAHVDGQRDQIGYWFYVKNWTSSPSPLPHFWSLCVEEQFYLCWPFVVRSLKPKSLLWLAVAMSVVALVSRSALFFAGNEDGAYAYTTSRMDALALGGAAAILLRQPGGAKWMLRHAKSLALSSLAAFALVGVASHGYPRAGPLSITLGYTVIALVFTVFLTLAVLIDVGSLPGAAALRHPFLRTLGKYSYGMYVVHHPLHVYVLKPLFDRLIQGRLNLATALAYNVVALGVTTGVAMASFHLVEKHFLSLKRYFEARSPSH